MDPALTNSQSDRSSHALDWAHPLVREWFLTKFREATEPQEQGWPSILKGQTTLISAPTGSGKTFAAFLACIDGLVRKALSGELENKTEVVYVSPLKALGNDIQKNLEGPLSEIVQLAGRTGLLMPEIRTAVRTGDTLMSERRAMLTRPPHILVTTPESLYILLTAEKSRAILRDVRTVIVDEIHAVAGSKRGAHLALSLERLDGLADRRPVRIGLSATQKPLEVIAHFLTGTDRKDPVVIDIGHKREMDLAIEVPRSELGPVASNEMWEEMYDRIADLVRQHRSTLVFVNTRRLAERVAMHLAERLGEEAVAAHHGSLARKIRLNAENRLKSGELSVLVATASLELGIDIGAIELVCQIGSPRSISVALQRVGRSGHWRGATPKARLFATTRDELLECAALVRAIHRGELDRIIVPECPLDVLAQQIVAECAARTTRIANVAELGQAQDDADQQSGITEDEMFRLLRRAYPYADLPRHDFEAVVSMISDGIAARRGRYGAYLHRDRVHGRLRARRGARLAAITGGGAIPDTSLYTMVSMPEETIVGTLDEDFATESNAGDIILLGNTSWRIRRVEAVSGRVVVEDAHGAAPSVPFWRGEAPARTAELSQQVAELRQAISDMLPPLTPIKLPLSDRPAEVTEAVEWLKQECALNDAGAEQAIEHILAGRAVLGAVPTQKTIVAERFFDEGGGMQLVIHAPFGGRVNKAWGLALRKRFCRSFNFELQASATDDGINIALAEQHSFPLADVFGYLSSASVKDVLEQAVLTGSPLFGTRWRWDATRALALLRFQHGKKVPPQIQRMRSDDLLASVFPDVAACFENIDGDIQVPEHPLVREVMKDVLHEAMDVDGLVAVLRGIEDGSIQCVAVDTPVPSQFSHEILNSNPYAFLDDAPLEERRARAVQMRQVLPDAVAREVGKLDPEAIGQVCQEAWPDVRDADELHDTLQTLVAVPEDFTAPGGAAVNAVWGQWMSALIREQRAGVAILPQPIATDAPESSNVTQLRRYWVAAERVRDFRLIAPDAKFESTPFEVSTPDTPRSEVILTAVGGWMLHSGPLTSAALSQILRLRESDVEQALLRMEANGTVLRGNFTGRSDGKLEWCERGLLARIHRLTIGRLRKEIEPVSPAQYMNWLLRWQHLAPGSQVHGERGLLDVIRQLQGFEVPANAWERDVLARRISQYDPQELDKLCLMGTIGWGRLSPHPATIETSGGHLDSRLRTRRVIPTSVAPITFFVREEADWMSPRHPDQEDDSRILAPAAQDVLTFLRNRGASFFTDIVRGTLKLKAEVETALWELVAAGLVTADGFDNLRSLIDPKRRAGQGRGRISRPRNAVGRWALLYGSQHIDRAHYLEAVCRILLARYGVVFRDVLARESNLPAWREILMMFRRMEDRGDVRGGRFVGGFLGEQFALPLAVESLRAARKRPPSGEVVTLSAADPLNLVGVILPGERIPAVSGKHVAFRDGVPVDPPTHQSVSLTIAAS